MLANRCSVMRLRYKVVVSAVLIALLLFAMWLAFHSGVPRHNVSVAFTTAHGHFPEPAQVVADQIIVAWVTNTGRSAIALDEPCVQFENAAGRLVRDDGSSWNQKGYFADLSPGSAAWLANGFGSDTKRLKFVFDYHRRGGPLLRAISNAARVLPLARLPRRTYDWLRQNGIVDGFLHHHYEGPWIANPEGGANGRQLSGSEANRTPPDAASQRSP